MNQVQVSELHFAFDLSQPLYEQVLNQVRYSIVKGAISLGAKMPSVRELAQALKINPNTVMRAYKELERSGLTNSHGSQGTYITTDAVMVANIRESLADAAMEECFVQMRNLGFTTTDIERMLREKGRE